VKFYAKTYYEDGNIKGETIEEHTENLLSGLIKLQEVFGKEIEIQCGNKDIWQDLKTICLIHDLGKLSTPFQNKIRKKLKKDALLSPTKYREIPHNYLSPAFLVGIPDLHEPDSQEHFYYLFYSIAFHHDRDFDFDEPTLVVAIETDIASRHEYLSGWIQSHYKAFEPTKPRAFFYLLMKSYLDGNRSDVEQLKSDKYFILLKGLLHRLDHAASAHLPVETDRLGDPTPKIKTYLQERNFEMRAFQEKAVNYRNENVILTASTGMGKTEFAFNWLGDSKGFYTLPLKVSVNAMYNRAKKIFSDKKVGIIHSSSYAVNLSSNDLKFDNEELSIESNIQLVDRSRQFAYPIIVTTADQLFTAVFKWPGYEKVYATLMYSKVILDEPQSYSPKTLAIIIKGLEDLAKYGARFCYMSATHHPFIIKKLKKIAYELEPVYNTELKHKIRLQDCSINQLSNSIISRYKSREKVLVIVNTVKKCQDLFVYLSKHIDNIHLLHSGFIREDRDKKEKAIQDDYEKDEPVVWVSTQIVEASLDIDYDVLFTEIATLDTLIQRMGRIFRGIGRNIKESHHENVIIACSDPSDKGFIYNKEIVDFTKVELQKFNNGILSEQDKQKLMNAVFDEDRLRNTNFLNEYTNAYNLLAYGFTTNKNEAQFLFREIDQVSAMPERIYSENEDKINSLMDILKSKDRKEKIDANTQLNQFVLSVPSYKKQRDNMWQPLEFSRKSDIWLIPAMYDVDLGLKYGEIENVF